MRGLLRKVYGKQMHFVREELSFGTDFTVYAIDP